LQPSGPFAEHTPDDMGAFSGYRGVETPAPAIGAGPVPAHIVGAHVSATLPRQPVHGGEPVAVQPNFEAVGPNPHAVPVTPDFVHLGPGQPQ
jgi:hypothetical protein